MSWEYLILGLVAVLIVLMIIFRKHPIVKLCWKYTLVLIPLVVLMVLKIISNIKPTTNTPTADKPDPLGTKIQGIKDDLTEAQMTTAVQVAAAKQKNNDTLTKLEEVKKITDRSERIKQLAAMIG